MTQAALRPPPSLQSRPKVIPTFSSASIGGISRSATPGLSRQSSHSRHVSPIRTEMPIDSSDKAAATLVRRVLCPHTIATSGRERSIDESLPPLTSSNDVDLQLYAIIAIVIKDLVHSWYGKITSDQTFAEEVIKIVAHCTRALEGRLRLVDLELLLLDEIPALVEAHIHSFRLAHGATQSQDWSVDPKILYHNLIPHPALEPMPSTTDLNSVEEQMRNETNYRHMLVQSALAVLLPTEDLDNSCLRTLVTDVIAEVVLGNSVGGKACENWFIWSSITKLALAINTRILSPPIGEGRESDGQSRLEKFGLLVEKGKITAGRRERSTFSSVFWRILQYGYLGFAIIRFVVVGLFAARSGPRRSSTIPRNSPSTKSPTSPIAPALLTKPLPIIRFRLFSFLATLTDLRYRMPWLAGSMALIQHHLTEGSLKVLGGTDGMLDQFIHNLLQAHLPPSKLLPQGLSLLRQAIFPQNSLPPPPPPAPSPDEIQSIKRECAAAVLNLLPPALCTRLFGPVQESWSKEIEVELEIWDDSWMNKHLGYRIVELIMVRVLPEIAESGPKELLEMRLGSQS